MRTLLQTYLHLPMPASPERGWRVTWCGVLLVACLVSSADAGVLDAAYSYRAGFAEDFDGMGEDALAPGETTNTYWSVILGTGDEYATNLTVGSEEVWGGNFEGYNARGSVTDRHLAIYRSSSTSTAYLLARFRNDTGATMRQLELYYDLECSWLRYSNTTPRRAELKCSFGLTPESMVDLPSSFDGGVANTNPATQDLTWYTDAEMDALSLSQRGLGGTVDLTTNGYATVTNGGTFYVRWNMPLVGDVLYRHMNVGIDNLRGPAAISLAAIRQTGAWLEITSEGVIDPDAMQVLQRSTNLLSDGWADVATNTAPALTNLWQAEAETPWLFFRIEERPASAPTHLAAPDETTGDNAPQEMPPPQPKVLPF